jgi:hypothetical protein
MNQKFKGYHQAPGYWGRSPAKIIDSYQIIENIRVLLQDKLTARGEPAKLWLPVDELTPDTIQCTCVKNTGDTAQRLCPSCYGVSLVPGLLKFGCQTLYFDVAEYTTFTLTGVERDTVTKPNMFEISDSLTSGTIETPDKTFTNPNDDDWEVESQFDLKRSGNSVTVEFSTDSGINFFDISTINGVNKPTGTSGNIRLRITLTRASVITSRRGTFKEVNPGEILILPTWTIQGLFLGASTAHQIEDQNHRMWTAPLDFFDTSLTADTPDTRIFDVEEGVHPMIEYSTGTEAGRRYALISISSSEQLGRFTHQAFTERKAQRNEVYNRTVF